MAFSYTKYGRWKSFNWLKPICNLFRIENGKINMFLIHEIGGKGKPETFVISISSLLLHSIPVSMYRSWVIFSHMVLTQSTVNIIRPFFSACTGMPPKRWEWLLVSVEEEYLEDNIENRLELLHSETFSSRLVAQMEGTTADRLATHQTQLFFGKEE